MVIKGLNGSEKLHKLGNKNRMTDYNLQCINCRKERNINLEHIEMIKNISPDF